MSKRGKPLNSQCRELVIKLQDYFERESQNGGPLLPVTQVQERVAAALGISPRTINRINKEKFGASGSEENKLRSPKKKKRSNPVNITPSSWAQVKGYAARHNTTPPFSTNKMMGLLKEACSKVTREDWAKVVEKIRKQIMEDYDRDIRIDTIIDNEIVIQVTDDDNDTDDDVSSSEDDSD